MINYNNFCNSQQSVKLAKLGFIELTSLFWCGDEDGYYITEIKDFEAYKIPDHITPAYTAQDISKHLPEYVEEDSSKFYFRLWKTEDNRWKSGYFHWSDDTWALTLYISDNIAECFADNLIWLIENEYCKKS